MKLPAVFLALALVPLPAGAQSITTQLSCTSGPYRLNLPKSYKGLRTLGHLRRERVLQSDGSAIHRELRFDGLELLVVTTPEQPNRYTVSRAIVSSRAWKISGPLRVGASAKAALRSLAKDLPAEGEMEFNGDADSIRVNLSRGRVLDFEYSCSAG